MLLSLFVLCLFAISAVSAADNVTDDIVGVEDVADDELAVGEDVDVISEDIQYVDIEVWSNCDLDDSRDYFIDITAPKAATGNITVKCDDVIVFDKDITQCRYDGEYGNNVYYCIGHADLNATFDVGHYYRFKVSYTSDGPYLSVDKQNEVRFYSGDRYAPNDNVTVILYNQIYLDRNHDWEDYLVRIEAPVNATGNVRVLINGQKAFERKVATMYIHPSDLTLPLAYDAIYNVEVIYDGDGNFPGVTQSGNVKTTCQFDVYLPSKNIEYGSSIELDILLPENPDGILTVTVGGQTYPVTYDGRQVYFNVSTEKLTIGNQSIYINYTKDSVYPDIVRVVNFAVKPHLIYSNPICLADEPIVIVCVPEGSSGTVTIVSTDFSEVSSAIVEGNAIVKLPKFYSASYKTLRVKTIINGQSNIADYSIRVMYNSPGYASEVSSSEISIGDNVTVTITGSKESFKASIMVDGVKHDANTTDYIISENVIGLAEGQHVISVYVYNGTNVHSKNFLITVKDPSKTSNATTDKTTPAIKEDVVKLTLKKVKVKKSAKKLTLQVTVKVNGKAKKGLKVIFKFNGKKYTAKTNAKGVAKVTIKKKVLKKLKVGKKVNYQASYGKVTVKKTVKVKK